jgi:hypothetical protein
MDTNEVKQEIKNQISKIDATFSDSWSRMFQNEVSGGDIERLSIMLKKVSKSFNFYRILSSVSSGLLILISLSKYFTNLFSIDMNKAGLVILITISLLVSTYRFYKMKVNLETKINLVRLNSLLEK